MAEVRIQPAPFSISYIFIKNSWKQLLFLTARSAGVGGRSKHAAGSVSFPSGTVGVWAQREMAKGFDLPPCLREKGASSTAT